MSEKFYLAHLFRPIQEGARVRGKWPLHMTIVPPVEGHYYRKMGLDKIASRSDAFDTSIIGKDYLGTNNDVRAEMVGKVFELTNLRVGLISQIESLGYEVPKDFEFNPHFSSGGGILQLGQKIHVNEVSVLVNNDGNKHIVHNMKLRELDEKTT